LDGATGMVIAASLQPTSRTNYWAIAYMRSSSDGFVFDSIFSSPSSGWRYGQLATNGFGQTAAYTTSSLLPAVVTGRFLSSKNYIYTGQTSQASTATSSATIAANVQPLYVGGRAPGTSLAPLKIRELVICKTGLTDNQLASLQVYLARQSGQ